MSSGYFIDRPVFAAVISILIVLGGLVAMTQTPVALFPEITPPTVVVSASYPGATAEVLANTVAAPIEQQVNGVDGMAYMLSSSASGNYGLTITFEPGTNPDLAQVNVQKPGQRALARLPSAVTQQGVTVQKRSSSFMMAISFYSPDNRYEQVFLNNFTNLYVLDPVKRIPGANLSSMFPTPDLAMRVWLKPDRMAQLGITAQDVANAIKGQNQAFGIGQIGQTPTTPGSQQTFVVTTQGMLEKPAEFDEIIIRASKDKGAIVRLKDVARTELGAMDYSITNKVNGKLSSTVMVYQQPGANAIQTSAAVRRLIEELKPTFPPGIEYIRWFWTPRPLRRPPSKRCCTPSERRSCCGAGRLPVPAEPARHRHTDNRRRRRHNRRLHRHLCPRLFDKHADPVRNDTRYRSCRGRRDHCRGERRASHVARPVAHGGVEKGDGAACGALIAIVLVLVSVFLPVAFLGGMTGTLYKQFAITIAISMAISAWSLSRFLPLWRRGY
jgi:multidrug efflux pump subunit AcrB